MQDSILAFFSPELRVNSIPFVTAYDGDEGTATVEPVVKPTEKVVPITQEQIDAIVEGRLARQKASLTDEFKSKEAQAQEQINQLKGGLQAEKAQLLSELEEVRDKFQGTEAEKAQLQRSINTLKNEQLSAEEQAAARIKELEERLNTTESTLTEQLKYHKDTYSNYRIEQELRTAAIANGALVPDQLMTLLRPQTFAAPVLDGEGKEIPGAMEVKIKLSLKDGDKTSEVELSPAEAIAKLREDVDSWGNQFSSESKAGTGLINEKGKSGPDGLVLNKGYAEYKKSRESAKGKSQLGINSRGRFVGKV